MPGPNFKRAQERADFYVDKYAMEDWDRKAKIALDLIKAEGYSNCYFQDLKPYAKEHHLKDYVTGYMEVKDDVPTFHIEETDTDERQNFTIAHEFGHYVLRHWEDAKQYEQHLYLQTCVERNDHPFEQEANHFAAALLMPKRFIAQAFQTGYFYGYSYEEAFEIIRKRMGVSRNAFLNRLDFLGLTGYF